jgi:mono/diheme cytochrome c family protein
MAAARGNTRQAPRARSGGRWASIGALVVILSGVVAAGALWWARRPGAEAPVVEGAALPELPPADDPRALARGAHVAEALGGCTGCHGPALRGGPSPGLGGAAAPDLVGGRSAAWALADRARAVRDCVTPDGALLVAMPCDQHAALALSDLSAALAAIERWPQRHAPPPAGPPAQAARPAQGSAARRAREPSPPLVPPSGAEAQGRYLFAAMCAGCHGPHRPPGAAVDLALAQPAPGQPDPLAIDARAPGGAGLDGAAAPALGGQAGRPVDRLSLEGLLRGEQRAGGPAHPAWVAVATAGLRPDEVDALWGVLSAEAPRPPAPAAPGAPPR